MPNPVPGLHHVTAICGPAQANVAFYTQTMGQRLVKKTVNFDDPGTYHLYYGDRVGTPGTILTFFPFAGRQPGRAGTGLAESYAYVVPASTLEDWAARLTAGGAHVLPTEERFGTPVLPFTDPDGQRVELVGTDAPDGFHSVTLWVEDPGPTAQVLTDGFGYREVGHERAPGRERLRLQAQGGARGAIVDLLRVDGAEPGQQGRGTIHYVAFRATDDTMQDDLRERVNSMGRRVTPRIDRQYFNAVYFREPGGILFEIATDPPGFTIDEPEEALGTSLCLPPQYEADRARIEANLPPLVAPG